MFFKRLEIHGFKSFAEPVVIEFDKGITCVVGPNGSGKSNICDALRWVLGEQSSKMLRGDKMEDVIFAGTENRRSRGMAEVTLIIDNSDGAMPIDFNEVAITRRMYRSGESEYLINGNRCRMKDIRELIMDTGIGVEGYSIIGQGKISDIISNNTESIREILEETAGIVMYRSRKANAERKLSSANINMDRVNDIIGEIESRIGVLKTESEKASEYLALRERYRELEINITLRNIEKIEEQNEEALAETAELDKAISSRDSRKKELEGSIAGNGARRDHLYAEIDALQLKRSSLSSEIGRLENAGRIRDEKIASADRDIERLSSEITDLKSRIDRENENAEALFSTKMTADEKLDNMRRGLESENEKLSAADAALESISARIEDGKNRAIELQSLIGANAAEMNGIKSMKDNLADRLEKVNAEKKSGETKNVKAEEELEKAKRMRAEIKSSLNAAEAVRRSLSDAYTEHYEREKQLGEEIGKLNFEIGKLSSRRKTIEEMESNYEGYNHGVRAVMKSGITGIIGTVAELIDVPKGFEEAIEAALGASLQNIICDSDNTAKKAVGMLKDRKAGRATFLPVGSVNGRPADIDDDMRDEEGFLGAGSECVSSADELVGVVRYLLGRTAVVSDLGSAIAMSKKYRKGLRFVTLDGDIINAGGAITGGRYKNRTADLLQRKAETAGLAEKLSEIRKDLSDMQEERAATEASLIKESDAIRAKEKEIREIEREYFAQENIVSMTEGALSDHRESARRLMKEICSIGEEQSKSEVRLVSLEDTDASMKKEMEDLKEAIADLSEEYGSMREKRAELSAKITDARIELGAFESEKNSIDVIVEKTAAAIRGYEKDMEDRSAALDIRNKERAELEGDHSYGEDVVVSKRKEHAEVGDELEERRSEKDKLTAVIEADTGEKAELDNVLGNLRERKYQMEIRSMKHVTQLENAKAKLWDEFEISYLEALDLKDDGIRISGAVSENREIKKRLRELGDVNIGAIEEYRQVSERYGFLTKQREDIIGSTNELNKIISDMDRIIRGRFKASFDSVTENFEEVFRELYSGGHARISLADENDPFGSEIEITAQPPGKQLKHINLLSGGEKTMTAIALMFAVLKTKPTPFCILDEIEAALDDQNLDIFGNYVRRFSGVQFALITHQRSTMEHADTLYGITMPESGVSKVYSLKMDNENKSKIQ